MKKAYIGSLYRFGYELTTIGTTKKAVVDAIMAEYEEAFRNMNGTDSKEEIYDGAFSDGETSFYDEAKGDLEIRDMTVGKVEWM